MDIIIAGHQVDLGDALKAHVTERMEAIAEKYFSRTIGATITFGKGPHDHGFQCDIVAHVPQGLVMKSSDRAGDAHMAFEAAATKIEKQLRRYGRRLKDKHAASAAEASGQTGSGGLDSAGYTVFGAGGQEEEEAPDAPLIIAETRVDVPDATVSDAVMMLDLRHTNALLFKNTGTGAFNMVYRRDDGTIGWVEPARENATAGAREPQRA